MTWSVSRVRARPSPGGGLEIDVSVTGPTGESSVLSLELSSRAADELREILRDMMPRA